MRSRAAVALEPCELPLTERQTQVLEWLRAYIATNGYSPTVREIGSSFGIRSINAVHDHLIALRRKGRVMWIDGRNRTIRVLEVTP